MLELIRDLFSTDGFPPRWHCGAWSKPHGWVHICSDAAIFGAYAAIPVALGYFALKRKDVPFPRTFWLFGAFILACGTGHLIEATIFWHPWYRLAGAVKLATAVVSWATVVALIRVVPRALHLPGLARLNEDLVREIRERERMMVELRHLEASESAMLNAAPDAIISIDAGSRVVAWNRSAERTFGYSAAEATGRLVEDLIVPAALREQHRMAMQRFAGSGEQDDSSGPLEMQAMRADGTELLVELFVTRIAGAGPARLIGFLRDITERRLIEVQREQAEERIRIVVEAAPCGMLMVDPRGRMMVVNSQVERLFGYTRGELLLQAVEMLVPERYRAAHSGHREYFFGAPSARLMGAGRELFGRRKDGTEVPIEIGLNPVQTGEGAFVLASIIDITERKLAGDTSRRLAAIVEFSEDAIIGTDLAGKVTSWNHGAERTFGYSAEEMIGNRLAPIIPEDRIAEEAAVLGRVRQGERVETYETIRRNKNGSRVHVAITVSPIKDALGHFAGVSKISRDITESKHAEAQREAALEESGILLKEVHHRVKNNMQVISSLLRLHANKLHDPKQKRVFVECQDRIRVMSLIHERLYGTGQFARIEFGGYLAEMVRMILGSSIEAGSRVRLDLQCDPLEIDLDVAVPLSLIASELVINAFKHGFAGKRAGVLSIRLRAGKEMHALTVQDDGPGLPPAFAPEQAAGIGTELVEGLARQIRGRREFQSGPGGTSVTIRWPARRDIPEPPGSIAGS